MRFRDRPPDDSAHTAASCRTNQNQTYGTPCAFPERRAGGVPRPAPGRVDYQKSISDRRKTVPYLWPDPSFDGKIGRWDSIVPTTDSIYSIWFVVASGFFMGKPKGLAAVGGNSGWGRRAQVQSRPLAPARSMYL